MERAWVLETKKIKKSKFYKNKKAFQTDDIDANKILVSKEESYGSNNSTEYFIGYNDNDDVRPLWVFLPQMIGFVKCLESNKTMSFKISDNKLLKNYTQIWKKVKNLLNIKLVWEPVYGYNDKHIKTKIKIFDNNVNTNFHGEKVPKQNASYKCLSLIMLDSILKVNKKYYSQTLLTECKHEIKKTKMESLLMMN